MLEPGSPFHEPLQQVHLFDAFAVQEPITMNIQQNTECDHTLLSRLKEGSAISSELTKNARLLLRVNFKIVAINVFPLKFFTLLQQRYILGKAKS